MIKFRNSLYLISFLNDPSKVKKNLFEQMSEIHLINIVEIQYRQRPSFPDQA